MQCFVISGYRDYIYGDYEDEACFFLKVHKNSYKSIMHQILTLFKKKGLATKKQHSLMQFKLYLWNSHTLSNNKKKYW